jgi:hypothetical protein
MSGSLSREERWEERCLSRLSQQEEANWTPFIGEHQRGVKACNAAETYTSGAFQLIAISLLA